MLKQDIKFQDYNGNDREVTEYFHLNEAEIVELQAQSVNGLQVEMQEAILSNDASKVLDFVKMLVHKSYGKKSNDGLHFEKSPEILQKFINSAYYSDFLLGLIEDNGRRGEEFVKGIMPPKLLARALAQVEGQQAGEADRTVYAPSAREVFANAQAAKTQGAVDVNTTLTPEPVNGPTGYTQAEEVITPAPQNQEEWENFQRWQTQQQVNAEQAAFRVRDTEQSTFRPPHEQMGDAQ